MEAEAEWQHSSSGREANSSRFRLILLKDFSPHRNVIAKTLLAGRKIQDDEKAYFKEFLEFYHPVKVAAYSLEEILCEKIRAILTRQAMKLRDIYDVFMIEQG